MSLSRTSSKANIGSILCLNPRLEPEHIFGLRRRRAERAVNDIGVLDELMASRILCLYTTLMCKVAASKIE